MIENPSLEETGMLVIGIVYNYAGQEELEKRYLLYDLKSGTDVLTAIKDHIGNTVKYNTVKTV